MWNLWKLKGDTIRFYYRYKNGKYQLFDREGNFSFNPCDDEWLISQMANALNCLEHESEYKPIIFKTQDGQQIKLYQRDDKNE